MFIILDTYKADFLNEYLIILFVTITVVSTILNLLIKP